MIVQEYALYKTQKECISTGMDADCCGKPSYPGHKPAAYSQSLLVTLTLWSVLGAQPGGAEIPVAAREISRENASPLAVNEADSEQVTMGETGPWLPCPHFGSLSHAAYSMELTRREISVGALVTESLYLRRGPLVTSWTGGCERCSADGLGSVSRSGTRAVRRVAVVNSLPRLGLKSRKPDAVPPKQYPTRKVL